MWLRRKKSESTDREVYSLPRIIVEIQANRALFTRYSYICVDGDPYIESPARRPAYHRHMIFDSLSKTNVHSRSPDDVIDEDVLKSLEKRLKKTRKVRTFADKVWAHGADPKTRDEPLHDMALSFWDLDSAYRAVISVAHYLSAKVLYGTDRQFLETYLVDTLVHFENPLCPASRIEKLRHAWHTRYEELEKPERTSKSANA